jgi:hypothetical protein
MTAGPCVSALRCRPVRGKSRSAATSAVRGEASLANRIHIDLVDLEERLAEERLLAGVLAARVRPADKRPFAGAGSPGASGEATFPGRQSAIFNVPPRSPNFTGRSELLRRLRRDLSEGGGNEAIRPNALYGLSGVGKTQLTIEYAHRFATYYDLVWWIPAENPKPISGHLAALK